eukprot:242792-Prorocentrum_minimum.AAC.1
MTSAVQIMTSAVQVMTSAVQVMTSAVQMMTDSVVKWVTKGLTDRLRSRGWPPGYRIWAHVADPSRLIDMDDVLDLAGRERGTSAYLPTGTIPMFPWEVAAGPMSLTQVGLQLAVKPLFSLPTTGEFINSSPNYLRTVQPIRKPFNSAVTANSSPPLTLNSPPLTLN